MAGEGEVQSSSEETAAVAGISLDACRACGYTIRGLSIESACPECGTAIGSSRASLTLAGADPAWLKRLVKGLSFGGAFALINPIFLLRLVRADAGLPAGSEWMWPLLGIGMSVSVMFATRGMLDITARDPRETERESPHSDRIVARVAYLASLGVQVASVLASYAPAGSLIAATDSPAMRKLTFVFLTIAVVACARRLRWLAQRIPDEKAVALLRSAEGWTAWSWTLAIVLLVIPDVMTLPRGVERVVRISGLLSFVPVAFSLLRISAASHTFVKAMEPIRDLPSLRKARS